MAELIYSSTFNKDSYKIIELGTDELVQEFESGDSVTIKGLPEDEAVLCTSVSTYTVRQVYTSNSFLLLRNDKENQWHVHDDISNTVELLPCPPRLTRLNTLLSETLYTGPENENLLSSSLSSSSSSHYTFGSGSSITTPKLYTFEQLLSVIQASQTELLKALEDMNCFVLNGYYRCISHPYLHQMLDGLSTNATIMNVDIRRMTLKDANLCLDQDFADVPSVVRMAFLQTFVKDISQPLLCLDDYKVCRFLGNVILESERGREWKIEDFSDYWERLTKIVLDIQPDITALKGLYYTTERQVIQKNQIYITYFPFHELPTEPSERFTRLFSEKSQWSPEDIFPYVDDIARDEKQRDALLLKFTRLQKFGNKTFYGSRIK
ncbi:sister chromatid cohesion protein Dcc1 [Cunninghamella echinulata]|nr:sister chromatid cohesion protein Dcc1 [Cunninghamella echinulata]